jgi:hypothetical protein
MAMLLPFLVARAQHSAAVDELFLAQDQQGKCIHMELSMALLLFF